MTLSRNLFDFVDNAPDIATVLIAILVNRLGGSVVLTSDEISAYNGRDMKEAINFTFDDEAETFGLVTKPLQGQRYES